MDELKQRVAQIEEQLSNQKNVLNFDEASKFLSLSKSYLYKLTSTGAIPHFKPQGKMIYFERTELEDWLRRNPVKTKTQIQEEAANYVIAPPKKSK